MITFRYHRGGLDESLATQFQVQSIDELKEKVCPKDSMEVVYYGYDSRIGWDTYLVCNSKHPIGMLKFN